MFSGKKILIVDDDPVITYDLRSVLAGFGFHVIDPAHSASEAVKSALENRPDLLLMDINLETGDDGIAAVQAIKKIFDIPVIYLTAHSEDEVFERASETKPYGYLVKPVNRSGLYTTVMTAFHRFDLEKKLFKSE